MDNYIDASPEDVLRELNDISLRSQRLCYIVADSKLQCENRDYLMSLLEKIKTAKGEMAERKDEEQANRLLSIEMIVSAIIDEQNMWLAIKEGRVDAAWDFLIGAQVNIELLMGFSDVDNIETFLQRLLLLEMLLFPPQVFLSSGIIAAVGKCSICGEDYDICNHVKGRAYMGDLCTCTIEIIKVNEVSFVNNPMDKRCRAFQLPDGNVKRDAMTWNIVEDNPTSLAQPPRPSMGVGYIFKGKMFI